MSFSLRSSLATASNCFCRSGMGFVCPRWVIQPVPVYSQYMSISPDSNAFRAATVPARPIWSFTVAPAFSRTCSVIWPRINCSVNSLEPTVNSALERSTSPDAPPPPAPPQPATIRLRTAKSPSSCVSFARVVRTAILLRSEERRVGKECRSLCDWSSDVCSSDLPATGAPATCDDQAQDCEEPQQLRQLCTCRSHSDPPLGSCVVESFTMVPATGPWGAGRLRPRRP